MRHHVLIIIIFDMLKRRTHVSECTNNYIYVLHMLLCCVVDPIWRVVKMVVGSQYEAQNFDFTCNVPSAERWALSLKCQSDIVRISGGCVSVRNAAHSSFLTSTRLTGCRRKIMFALAPLMPIDATFASWPLPYVPIFQLISVAFNTKAAAASYRA